MLDMAPHKIRWMKRGRTLAFCVLAVLVVASIGVLLGAKPTHAATTFTVTTRADARDANLANAACDVNASASGKQCTLRAAIQEANDTTGADTIRFNIVSSASVKTISLTRSLPTIREALIINGYTQPGARPNTLATGNDAILKIVLNGSRFTSNGLKITAGGATIKGLVINRFAQNSILISGPEATGNKVQGNFIGTNPYGTEARRTARNGVLIMGASNNTIGGTDSAARNLISGSYLKNGVLISGSEATGNKVQGNFIGTNASGIKGLSVARNGVLIMGAPNNTIGGTENGARNLISTNQFYGIQIDGSEARGNKVQGNFIGTAANGAAAPTGDLGNGRAGVLITGAPNNTVGGTESRARNIISGNGYGVRIEGSGATGNKVQGNFIGTTVNGTQAMGNGRAGVLIADAPNNTIGGTTSGARNLISGNGYGVQIDGFEAEGNKVQGNFIGTTINGTRWLSNHVYGVHVVGAPDNTIGGTTSGAGNVISGNGDGIQINGFEATGNKVQGNFIGTTADGTVALGNGRDGVRIVGAPDNTVGGTESGAGNIISGNDGDGVQIEGDAATGNSVLSNQISENRDLGIDLSGGAAQTSGVTNNDSDDPDDGANNLQNFPSIASAMRSSVGVTTISGTIDSNPNQEFTIQCFIADGDPSNHGEGEIFLDQTTAQTDPNGDGSFTCPTTGAAVGQEVSATATNTATGDTSEFSANETVEAGP